MKFHHLPARLAGEDLCRAVCEVSKEALVRLSTTCASLRMLALPHLLHEREQVQAFFVEDYPTALQPLVAIPFPRGLHSGSPLAFHQRSHLLNGETWVLHCHRPTEHFVGTQLVYYVEMSLSGRHSIYALQDSNNNCFGSGHYAVTQPCITPCIVCTHVR